MLLKLILLAGSTVTGAYGFIELIFLENLDLGVRMISLLLCAAMYHFGCKAFKRNWKYYCSEEYEMDEVKREMRRRRAKVRIRKHRTAVAGTVFAYAGLRTIAKLTASYM